MKSIYIYIYIVVYYIENNRYDNHECIECWATIKYKLNSHSHKLSIHYINSTRTLYNICVYVHFKSLQFVLIYY